MSKQECPQQQESDNGQVQPQQKAGLVKVITAITINELTDEAEEQANLLMDSMTLEVTGVQDGLITLSMRLTDLGAFIDDYLDAKIVDDVKM